MMRNKKSQAAMEFLMTYGWALLVVLIAIAALAFFGLLNPARFLPEKCEIAPGLTCMGFTASTDGESGSEDSYVTILLNNGIGMSMENLVLNVTNCDERDESVDLLSPGDTVEMTATECRMTANTRLKSDMILSYETAGQDQSSPLSHSKKGKINVDVNLDG